MIRVEWWKKFSTTRDAVTRLDFERIHWCREKEEKNLINFERIDTFTPTSFDVYHAEYNKFPFYIISDFVSKENFGNVFIIWIIVRLIWKRLSEIHEYKTMPLTHQFYNFLLGNKWMRSLVVLKEEFVGYVNNPFS